MQLEQLASGLHWVEPDLLQRHADPPPYLGGVFDHVEAGDGGAAPRSGEQRAQHPDGRRLAGAVRAEEAEHLAGGHRQVDVADGLDPALERAP